MSPRCWSARTSWDLLDEPDFHVAVLQIEHGTLARDGLRLFKGVLGAYEDPSDRFLRLDEGPVNDLPAAHRQARTRLVVQLVRGDVPLLLLKRAHPRHVSLAYHGRSLRVPAPLVEVSAS